MELVRRLHQETDLTIVMVTHNLNVVANYARRLAIVDRERGIFSVGAVEGDPHRRAVKPTLWNRGSRL